MINVSNIILFCWLIFLGYWIINWKSVKPTKEMAWKEPHSRWTFIWIVILLFILSRFFFHRNASFLFFTSAPSSFPSIQVLGILLTILGLIIAIVARKTLADNWSSNVELKKDHKLITTGVYNYTRHPIYTGIDLMGFGTIIALQSIVATLFFIFMVIFLMYKMKKEETLLRKHFPKEYPDYMKRTKALIPFIY